MQTEKRSVGRPPVITTEGLTAAADELVKANGLESLTVGQVAQALNVTTRALYHHIDGLRDLHMLVCDRSLSTIGNNNAGLSPADATRLILAELRNVIEEYRGLAPFVLQYGVLAGEHRDPAALLRGRKAEPRRCQSKDNERPSFDAAHMGATHPRRPVPIRVRFDRGAGASGSFVNDR
ncbi:MAG: TetR/AcrR family transcriptional regulator [Acidobacteria bacterium]|nr:TetR/AcrR family transcriptional regulator [Acidobacteriota bacterium]